MRFEEDRMDLYVRLEEIEVCLRNDGSICSRVESGGIPRGRTHTRMPRRPAVDSDVVHHRQISSRV